MQAAEKMDLPTHTLFVGEIIGAYADKEYMDKNNFNYEKAGAYFLTMMDNTIGVLERKSAMHGRMERLSNRF
jgi:flavin reductase (DIM6/NTAB) family NADH-FMN oxidoreductase RutF